VVWCLASAFSRGDGDVQVALNLILPDELVKAAGPEAGIKRGILGIGFTRYDASYLTSPPQYSSG
jgi:hypothetical protein